MITLDCDETRDRQIRTLAILAAQMMDDPHSPSGRERAVYADIRQKAWDADLTFIYAVVCDAYYHVAMAVGDISVDNVEEELCLLEIAVEELATLLERTSQEETSETDQPSAEGDEDLAAAAHDMYIAAGTVSVPIKRQDTELEKAVRLLSEVTALAEVLWSYALDSGADFVSPDVFQAANVFLASQPKKEEVK